MGDSLKIQVIVDGSQVTAGMDKVTSAVQSAATQIQSALGPAMASAVALGKELMSTGLTAQQAGQQMLQMGIDTQTVARAVQELASEAAPAAVAMEAVAAATENAGRSANNARAAFMGLNSELGLRGNRALGSFIAQSQTIGPILNTAFTGIAILGFIQLAELAADKISRLIADTFIFTQAQKDLDAQLIQDNKTIASLYEQHQQAQRGIQVIGLSALAAAEKKRQWAIEDQTNTTSSLETLKQSRDEEEKKLQTLLAQLAALEKQKSTTRIMPKVGPVENDNSGQINALKEQIDASTRAVTAFDSTLGVMQAKLVGTNDELERTNKTMAADAVKEHDKQYKEHIKTLEKYLATLAKIADGEEKLAEEQKAFAEAAQVSDAKDSTKDLSERINAEVEFQQARVNDHRQAATTEIDIEQEKVREMARLGQISADQEVQQLNALEKQKLDAEMTYINQRVNEITSRLLDDDAKAYADDVKEWSKLLTEKQKAEDTYLKNRQKNIDTASSTEQKTWNTLMNKINSGFDQSISGLMHGTMTFGKAFATQLDNLLADFVSFLAHKAEKWAEEQLLELALHSTFLSNLFGLDTANNAAKTAENATAAVAQVTQQAGVAGAAGFASVMADVPFPANVSLAPGVAASAIAATLSNISLASAAGGWDVPHDSLAMVHANEMILPANLSSGLKNLIGNGGGGDPSITVNYNGDFSAIDGAGMEAALSKNAAALTKVIRRELRRTNQI
jgi:hypothetical protein